MTLPKWSPSSLKLLAGATNKICNTCCASSPCCILDDNPPETMTISIAGVSACDVAPNAPVYDYYTTYAINYIVTDGVGGYYKSRVANNQSNSLSNTIFWWPFDPDITTDDVSIVNGTWSLDHRACSGALGVAWYNYNPTDSFPTLDNVESTTVYIQLYYNEPTGMSVIVYVKFPEIDNDPVYGNCITLAFNGYEEVVTWSGTSYCYELTNSSTECNLLSLANPYLGWFGESGLTNGGIDGSAKWRPNTYTSWALTISYYIDDIKSWNGEFYICIADHTSSSTTEPGIGANWESYWEVAPDCGDTVP